MIMIQITEYLYQALQNNYVGLGMYREWKKIEFPKEFFFFNINKNPTRCNSLQSDLFYCKITLNVLGAPHPSSGVLKTVTAPSGTGHNIGTATSLHGPAWPHWREVAVPILRPVLEGAVPVFSTPDDGCGGHPKHVE